MVDFKRIDLSSSPRTRIKSFKPKKSIKFSRKTGIILGTILVVLLVGIFAVVLPLRRVYVSAKATYAQAKIAGEAIKKQNVTKADTEIAKTKQDLIVTQKDLQALSYAQFIPLINGYYSDADHLIKAGFSGLDAAGIVISSVKPYADVLGLKGQGSFVMGSAEQRIQTAILTMGKITPRIDDVAKLFVAAKTEIDAVDPNHYPSFLGGGKIKSQLTTLRTVTDEGVSFVNDARPLIKVLPSLLGEKQEKKYLIIFQNDKELRPTGGFMTAYAVFRVDKGIITVERSDDIYALDATIPNKPPAPAPILKYLPKVPQLNLRDSNLSPDFIVSMKTFDSLYNKAGDKIAVDGIIALDTHVLVSIIKILDDKVIVGGQKFTTKNDAHCDCPQVIYTLENNISRPVGYIRTGRKDLLGSLLFAILQKSLKSSPKIYWGPLVQDLIAETNQKHILFYMFNQDAQSGIEALNAAGRIKAFSGDYLHINEANFGGAKSNLYVSEAVNQNYQISSDGKITKTITIDYKNPYPPSDCNLASGGLCLNATLRDWIRVYVPKGSQLVDSSGSEVKVTSYDELGKTVFDGFLTVRPEGTAKYTLTYTLPFKLSAGEALPFLIQKQPGTNGNVYTITVNGKTIYTFPLLTDKEITIHP